MSTKRSKEKIQPQDRIRSVIITLVVAVLVLLGGAWFIMNDETVFTSETISDGQGIALTLPKTANASTYSLYIDAEKFTVDGAEEEITKSISPGEHRIILTAEDYLPWTKTINIEKGKISELTPFMIQQSLSSRVYRVLKEPAEYQSLNNKLKAENQLTTDISSDGSVKLSFETGTITATYLGSSTPPLFFCENTETKKPCPTTKVVYQGRPVLDVAFYGDRNDVYVFGAPGGVYVTEITARTPQNLHPVYKGPLNAMAVFGGSVYLQDKGASGVIIEIPLFNTSTSTASSSSTPPSSSS